MNKPKTGKPPKPPARGTKTEHTKPPPRGTRTEQMVAGRVLSETGPKRKPTGTVIYKLSKGADVWPGRK